MAEPDLQSRVWALVRKVSPVAPRQPAPGAVVLSGSSDARMDSVAALRLVLALEEEFGITVEDKDISVDNFGNLARLCRYVERRLARS